jgi:glutamate racemase
VPTVGVVEPGAEAAAKASRNHRVVVIGTEATIASHAYRRALEARNVAVTEKACPLFVPLVEEGWVDHPVTEQVARIYLDEAFAGDAQQSDVLVLGCTHYPLLRPMLSRIAPAHVAIVDSAESTAHDVARRLQGEPLAAPTEPERRSAPRLKFFATDSAEKFRKMGSRFLGLPVEDVVHVDLKE